MLYENKKLLFHKLFWLALLLSGIIVPIIIRSAIYTELEIRYFFISDIFIFSFFIRSLLLSCKVCEYNGNDIIVYAGWIQHYIKVNGKIMDEINTFIMYTPISLSCTLDDGTIISASITVASRITLKINNQLYTNSK